MNGVTDFHFSIRYWATLPNTLETLKAKAFEKTKSICIWLPMFSIILHWSVGTMFILGIQGNGKGKQGRIGKGIASQ